MRALHFIFNTTLGQICGLLMLGVLIFGQWLTQHDAKVRTAVYQKSEKAGKVANAKATKAHDSAAQPGAADRAMKKYCRDC